MRRAPIFVSCALLCIAMTSSLACRPTSDAQGTLAEASASATASAAPAPLEPPALVTLHCLGCHSEEMLRQQRLTSAQWTNVVKKMTGWGSTLDPSTAESVVAYLAKTYGVDAGAFAPARVLASEAEAEIAPLADGPYLGGDAARGRALFTAACAQCHAPTARGLIGVNLVDRPILRRAPDMAKLVQNGRGGMPARPEVTMLEIADLLEYLRRLR